MRLSPIIKLYIEFVFDNQIQIDLLDEGINVHYPKYVEFISYDSIVYFMKADPEFKSIMRDIKLKKI